MIAWDQPWELAYEFHKREGLDVYQLAKILGRRPMIIQQWLVPRPCPTRPLAERVAMLRQMGVTWQVAAELLGFRRAYILRARLGHVRDQKNNVRTWHARYRQELKELRKQHGRA